MSNQRLSKMQKCLLLLLYSKKEQKIGGISWPAYTLHAYQIRGCLIRDLNKRELIRGSNRDRWIVPRSFNPAFSRSLSNLLEKGLIERTGWGRLRKHSQIWLTKKGAEICLKLIGQEVNFKEDFRNTKVRVIEVGFATGYKEYWIEQEKLEKMLAGD